MSSQEYYQGPPQGGYTQQPAQSYAQNGQQQQGYYPPPSAPQQQAQGQYQMKASEPYAQAYAPQAEQQYASGGFGEKIATVKPK